MGYSWVYLGDATIPDDRRADWLASSAAARPHGAVLGTEAVKSWRLHDPDVDYDKATVRRVLEALAEEPGAVVRFETGAIVVRVVADKGTDAWLTYRINLAAAFVQLAAFGGRGELDVVGWTDGPDRGFRVEASPASTTARTLSKDEVAAIRSGTKFAAAEKAQDAALDRG